MKKIIFAGLILSLIIAAGCSKSAKEKLAGSWKLSAVEGQTLSMEELKSTMSFTEDGKLSLKSAQGNEKNGTWEISEDGKTITVKSTEGETEVWNVQKLEDKILEIKIGADKEKITLEKI